MTGQKQQTIVIAGGGTAGWSAAAAMGKVLGKAFKISLVESEQIGTVGVGEATIPAIQTFNKVLGIDEFQFMKETNATIKLGINFENWLEEGHSYFHSFGRTGLDHWALGFQHLWLAASERGLTEKTFWDFSPETIAAMSNKCSPSLAYAFHLDSSKYAGFLRKFAEDHGVSRIEGKIEDVELNPSNGEIACLCLEDGTQVKGDFFIDCTGFRALLIGEALGVEYVDWSDMLFCDRAIAVQTDLLGAPIPYTRAMAHDAGWQWKIPLQNRVGNGIIYSSDHLEDEKALERLLANIDTEPRTKPNFIKFRPGMRQKQWHKNCAAIGLSSGFLEPLESTSIHLIHFNILRLIRLLPLSLTNQRAINEFNEQIFRELETIKDFLVLHYWKNNRYGDAFWDRCRSVKVSKTLDERVNLFQETGTLFRNLEELFSENSWVQVLMGQGVIPNSQHPVAANMDEASLVKLLDGLFDTTHRNNSAFDSHEHFLTTSFGKHDAA
jgi:tryptophan halogenase